MKSKAIVFRIIKICVDISMTVLLLLLMGYHLLDGATHEWLGISLFILFLIHNALNYKWYLVLFKGDYSTVRIIQTVFNFLLLLDILACVFSSMCVSVHVFSGINIGMARLGRNLHLLTTVWAFILMALHFGFHWSYFMGMAKKIANFSSTISTIIKWVLRVIVFGICAYGCYIFIIRKLWEEMFLLTEFKMFDYDKTIFLYFIESLFIFILFTSITYYLKKLIQFIKRKNSKK